MYNLTAIKTALEATSLTQVILPEALDIQGVDTAAELVTLVGAQISSRVYPSILPDEPVYPASVYQLSNAQRTEVDGYPILREDTYLLTVLDSTHSSVSTSLNSIRTALLAYSPASAAGAVTIEDQSDDYHSDLDLFQAGLILRFVHLARTDQSLSAAFVYLLDDDALSRDLFESVDVQATSNFAVLWIAKIPAGGVSALRSLHIEILSAISGTYDDSWSRIRWDGGQVVGIHGNLVLWRDTFSLDEAFSL